MVKPLKFLRNQVFASFTWQPGGNVIARPLVPGAAAMEFKAAELSFVNVQSTPASRTSSSILVGALRFSSAWPKTGLFVCADTTEGAKVTRINAAPNPKFATRPPAYFAEPVPAKYLT